MVLAGEAPIIVLAVTRRECWAPSLVPGVSGSSVRRYDISICSRISPKVATTGSMGSPVRAVRSWMDHVPAGQLLGEGRNRARVYGLAAEVHHGQPELQRRQGRQVPGHHQAVTDDEPAQGDTLPLGGLVGDGYLLRRQEPCLDHHLPPGRGGSTGVLCSCKHWICPSLRRGVSHQSLVVQHH